VASGASARPWRAAAAAPFVVIVAAAVLPYVHLLGCPLYPDAERAVTKNPVVAQGSIADVSSTDFWGRRRGSDEATGSYRPAVSLTYWLQVRTTGARPAPLHAFDLLVHAGAALLVFVWLRRGFAAVWLPVAAALLFAVHPALSEAVCSVVGRADLMAGTSFLAALVLHRRAAHDPHPGRTDAAALACLAVALLSKEYAVAFPFVLFLSDLLRPAVPAADPNGGAASAGGARSGRVRFWVLMAVLLGGYLLLRVAVLGSLGKVPLVVAADTPLFGRSFVDRVANAVWLLAPALRLLVVPIRLDHVYGFGTLPVATGTSDPLFLVVALAGVAAVVLGVLEWRRRRDATPLLALAMFTLPLLPALNTVGVTVVLFAERFLYVPAVGFVWMLAWVVGRVVRSDRGQKRAAAALVAVGLVFAALTARRVEDWRSNETLARAALRAHPGSAMALHEVGMMLAMRGELEQALPYVRRSLDVQGRPIVWRNYALILERLGRRAEAREAWARGAEASK
jgi:hypothetical protein